ncbi:MAG TPA: sulfite reductase subunit alpha [Terracidiphilus sp.]|jgi:sulfite reductase (NADPH) flavoprotein alpha-component|nr:sulfite reductase subunit alpha [Terracidiphilus sp.]
MPTIAAAPQVPFIPDNAPFTPEQIAWLNGFLAGMYASAPAAAREPLPSLKIAVLYATQSGNAEGLARKVAKELKAKGHVATLSALEGYTPASLAAERYAVLIASTYGEGDPPDAVQPFYNQLCIEHFPRFENLSYAVLALGDRSYEHFCQFGRNLDEKLQSLGAYRLCPRRDCDVDLDAEFTEWKAALMQIVAEAGTARPKAPRLEMGAPKSAADTVTPAAADTVKHSRENPYLAPIVDKRKLTGESSSKQTLHMAFSTAGSQVTYQTGDACGVIPQNDPALVDEILRKLKFSSEIAVQVPKTGTVSLREALLDHFQITRLTRKMVEAYATIGRCETLTELLKADRQPLLDSYMHERGLIDLVCECPEVLRDPVDLVAMLPRLSPRLYSISSSPAAHGAEIHTTVAVVRYQSHNRERGGVCSTMFADRTTPESRLPIYIQPNRRFRIPKEHAQPIIMIGPGTGIAPFRGFLHERRALGATGKNWLFFGDRSAATDFLYRDELESMQKDKFLTSLDLAFSRDQEKKVYVQDRMLEQAPLFWSWLQDGAVVYVCGDASRMAKDVDETLHTIVEQQGGMNPEAAQEFVYGLKEQHRYHRDVY